MREIVDRIVGLIEASHLNAKELCIKLGISVSSVSEWKKGKLKPSVNALIGISLIFNVSLDWILTGKEFEKSGDDKSKLTASEVRLLECFRRLPTDDGLIFLGRMLEFADKTEKTKQQEPVKKGLEELSQFTGLRSEIESGKELVVSTKK